MAAAVKFDDGSGAFVSNCFPVRPVLRLGEPGEGAWLEAHRAEQRRRFKAVVCPKPPRTYSRIRQERIAAERENDDETPEPEILQGPSAVLDGFYLMKHCCIEDPADLCSINISGLGLTDARQDDFQLFDNVAYINAGDNSLKLEIFNKFSILRELEIPVNGLSSIKLSHKMFRDLEMIDVSYNNLNNDDILELGYLRNLKVLYLSGNNLETLPENMAGFYVTESGYKKRRFPKLEILCLDDNSLNNYTAFAPLAGLKELKHLNLEKNEISAVPQLEPKTIKHDKVSDKTDVETNQNNIQPQPTDDKTQLPPPDVIPATKEGEAPSDQAEAEKPNKRVTRFNFGELNVPDMDTIEERTEDRGLQVLDIDGDCATDSEDEMDEEEAPAIPFPQLRFLTLAHNFLTEEEDLLPVAAWPNLTQVHIFDNPLTSERCGPPPMLKKFLTDRLGIDLIRKKPAVIKPPKDFPPQRKSRQVTSNIPPVPKCDVNKLLMIEASKRQPAIAPSPGYSSCYSYDIDLSTAKTPLPPINKTPTPEGGHDSIREESEEEEVIPTTMHVTIENVEETDQEAASGQETSSGHDETTSDAFFMTQIDEPTAKSSNQPPGHQYYSYSTVSATVAKVAEEEDIKPKRKVKNLSSEQLKLFKGYEELLYEDEYEKDVHVPSDLQNTVKALHYALKHPVVNNHTMRLDASQKPFLPYKRSDTQSHTRPQTKAEKISKAVEGIKKMNTVIESPLDRALTDKDLQRKYPEAAKLLREIQRKYANVHSAAYGENLSEGRRGSMGKRAQTELIYMTNKNTSMTDLVSKRPSTNL